MRIDPELDGRVKPRWRHYFRASHRRLLPSARHMIWQTLRYARPSFHPLQEYSTGQAVAYLASSPAAIAAAADMDAHRAAPPDLRGRQRPDRLFRALGALVSGYDWLTSGSYLRRRPTQQVNRDLKLVVDGVRVEVQDVRSVRLVAAGVRSCPPGNRAAISTCGRPSGGAGSTRCAATLPTAAPTGSRCDGSHR
jgi:hypothetical protein